MRKIVFLWIALIAVSMNAFADGKVSFTASAPDAVAVGDQFRLSYTVTTQKVRDFRAPSMKGFDVLMASGMLGYLLPQKIGDTEQKYIAELADEKLCR